MGKSRAVRPANIASPHCNYLSALQTQEASYSDMAFFIADDAGVEYNEKARFKIAASFDPVDLTYFQSIARESIVFGLDYNFSEYSVSCHVGIPQRMYKSMPRFIAKAFTTFIPSNDFQSFLKDVKAIRTLNVEGLTRVLNKYLKRVGLKASYSIKASAIITITCFIDAKASYPEYQTPSMHDLRLRGNIFFHRVAKFYDAILANIIHLNNNVVNELLLINSDDTDQIDVMCHAVEYDEQGDVCSYSDPYMTELNVAAALKEFAIFFFPSCMAFMGVELGTVIRLFLSSEYFAFHGMLDEEDDDEQDYELDVERSDLFSVSVFAPETKRQVSIAFCE